MKRLFIASLVAVAFAGCGGGPPVARPSLDGTWALDKGRSDLLLRGGVPVAGADVTLVIDHREPEVTVRRAVSWTQGSQVRQLHYFTDGRETTNRSIRGGEVRVVATWQADRLVTKGRQKIESPAGRVDADVIDTWSISKDGQTLTVESKTQAAGMPEFKRTEVYLRKG